MTESITVTGNLTADPEERSLGSGRTVTSFRVAAAHRRYDREKSQWIDVFTNYYSVSAFRSLGAHVLTSLKKGDRVIVVGRLHLRAWDNGTRQGMSADIDAESVGHDLLFGTTRYQPDGGPRAESDAAPETAAETTSARDADGWALPAVGGGAQEGSALEQESPTPF